MPQPLKKPAPKNKHQKERIVKMRKQERDRGGKAIKALSEKEREGARRAAQARRLLHDPTTRAAEEKERFADHLITELQRRLSVGMAGENQRKARYVPVNLTRVSEVDMTEDDKKLVSEMGVVAYTDFKSVNIHLMPHLMPGPTSDIMTIQDFVMAVKGLYHHEMGHVLYSVPIAEMWEEASQAVRDRFVAEGYEDAKSVHRVWNAVEDQRMESARVRDFPAAQRYFEGTMAAFMVGGRDDQFWEKSWLLLAGRDYLPQELLDISRKRFQHADPDQWKPLVDAYKAASTTDELMEALLQCVLFIRDEMPDEDGVPDNGTDSHDADARTGEASDRAQSGSSEAGDGSEGQRDENLLSAGKGEGDEYYTKRLLQDVVNKMRTDGHDEKERELIRGAMTRSGQLGLHPYTGTTRPMTPPEAGTAYAMANDLEMALQTYVTRADPSWVVRQEDGIISPIDYRTREPGDTDYHIGLHGDQGELLDLHVSVMADVSGSMASHMPQLSVCLMAMKLACDNLHIPNNFSIWSDERQSYTVFNDGPEEVVFPALGGTDPTSAFDDAVLRNEEDRPNHLFMVFTDGHWFGLDSVAPWKDSDHQQFVIVKWGQGPREVYGADAIVDLTELSLLPELLKERLDSMLDSVV